MKRSKYRMLAEALEARQLLTVTPAILELGNTPVANGTTITWPAGIALHLSAVGTVDSNHNPTGGTTFTGNTTPNNTQFQWNFGDTAIASDSDYSAGARVNHNTLTGFSVAHIYDTPSPDSSHPYYLTLTTTDEVGNRTSITIDVVITNSVGPATADANVSGGNVLYVNGSTGNDNNTGNSESAPLKDFAGAITRLASSSWQSNVQVRFARGQTFTLNSGDYGSAQNLTNSGLIIGAYGTGANPILYNASLGTIFNAWTSAQNWTVQDITFEGTSTTPSASNGIALEARGTNISIRDCKFEDLEYDVYGQGNDGVLVSDCSDSTPVYNYAIGDFSGQDTVVIGNSFTGASERPNGSGGYYADQPYVRFENTAAGNGHFLFEGNTVIPSNANDASVTLRGYSDFDYFVNNTIGTYVMNVGNGSNETGYQFNWVVMDSNRLVSSGINIQGDSDHVMVRNNVIEHFPSDNGGVPTPAIQTGNYYVTDSSGNIIGGLNDLQVINNTVYNSRNTTSGGRFINLSQYNSGVVLANNLMVDTATTISAELTAPSMSVFARVSDNIWGDPPGSTINPSTGNSEANLIGIGSTYFDVDTWNASYRNTINSGQSGASYNDEAIPVTISNDTGPGNTSGTLAVISGNANIAQSIAGAPWDFYQHVRPTSGNWTNGAVQVTSQLTGSVIGTSGSYNNQGNTIANVFDGNLSTFFDAPTASGSWAGLDLGSARIITQISYAPRSGFASRMVGGQFQGSNTADFSSGVTTLYTVTASPPVGSLTTVSISNANSFRYVRYLGPSNGYCNIAEAQFFGSTPAPAAATKLAGSVIGTSGSYNNQGNTIANVFDGSFSTFFDASTSSGAWVGEDLGSPQVVTQISYAPRNGWDSRMIGGQFQASNTADFSSGVVTLYTITSAPTENTLTTVTLTNTTAYRYYRYIGPNGAYCNISELEFEA
jgi:hypothetical protein